MTKGIERRSRLLRFLSDNPWIGLAGLAVGLAGVVATVATHLISRRDPELSYCVYPARTTLVQQGRASALHVYHGQQELTEDVFAVQVAIWNAGKKPIRPEHILEPVRIVTRPAVRMLEVSVRKQSRPVVDFEADSSALDKGVVPAKWGILERGDGAVVQLIYAGIRDAQIRIEGMIEGQRSISHVPMFGGAVPPDEQLASATLQAYVLFFSGAFFLVVSVAMGWMASSIRGIPRWPWVAMGAVLVLSGTLFIVLGYYRMSHSGPPFGF